MNDLKESLMKLGWNEDLIDHFIGKKFRTIDNTVQNRVKHRCYETHNIIINARPDDIFKNLYINNRKPLE